MTAVAHEVTARTMEPTRNLPVRTPATDIYETEQGVVVVADMPGVSEKGLEVTLENQVLTLVGHPEAAPESSGALHREFGPAEYRRSFTLTEDLDREKITARIKAGQVCITLPKAAKAQPRRIAVENAN
jgi:HSP20 family protein